jgi:hypothetical protein
MVTTRQKTRNLHSIKYEEGEKPKIKEEKVCPTVIYPGVFFDRLEYWE